MHQYFTNKLLAWAKGINREMPWKGVSDPYVIWLSEIILQQTRVAQGTPYFTKFVETFPDVESLANASEDEVMRLWQGLGYYSRARNMHAAAKYIADELGGEFPKDFQGLRALKGVGDYTAAAIASFAYDLPYAVVDGNVYRVLSRYFGVATPIDTTEGKKVFKALADQLISKKEPAAYNQAIMDLGALQCTPGQPDCDVCPLTSKCKAFDTGEVLGLPVKLKRVKVKERQFHFIVLNDGKRLYLRKRTGKDIWKNLYDFPLVELQQRLSLPELEQSPYFRQLVNGQSAEHVHTSTEIKQTLTHQKITGVFFEFRVSDDFVPGLNGLVAVEKEKIDNFAFPKLINCYFEDKILYSNIT